MIIIERLFIGTNSEYPKFAQKIITNNTVFEQDQQFVALQILALNQRHFIIFKTRNELP